MMSGCEDRKICLGEVYLQITASRDCQLMESALVSVSNNIANITANVCSILVPRYCSDDYCVSNIRIPWALKGIRTLARDQALTLCVDTLASICIDTVGRSWALRDGAPLYGGPCFRNDPEVPTFLPTSNCSVARETSTRRTVL